MERTPKRDSVFEYGRVPGGVVTRRDLLIVLCVLVALAGVAILSLQPVHRCSAGRGAGWCKRRREPLTLTRSATRRHSAAAVRTPLRGFADRGLSPGYATAREWIGPGPRPRSSRNGEATTAGPGGTAAVAPESRESESRKSRQIAPRRTGAPSAGGNRPRSTVRSLSRGRAHRRRPRGRPARRGAAPPAPRGRRCGIA